MVLGIRTKEKIKGKREAVWSVVMFILEIVMISINKGANQLALILYTNYNAMLRSNAHVVQDQPAGRM